MKLGEIAEIIQGIPLNRVRRNNKEDLEKKVVYSFEREEGQILVPKDTEQYIPLVEEDTILFNLISYRAKKAVEVDTGKVLPSNYVIIKVKKDIVCPDYLAWYMNYAESFKRELEKLKQGTTVMSLPINEIRKMKIHLPSLEVQEKIGLLNSLIRKKKILLLEKQDLISKSLITINEEEINNG